MVKKRWVAQGI
jgi:hypothetical protein